MRGVLYVVVFKAYLPHLNLLHSQVKEGPVTAHGDETLWPHAPHTRPETPVQLQHHQLVQQALGLRLSLRGWCDRGVGDDRVVQEGLDLVPNDAVPCAPLAEELVKDLLKARKVRLQLL